MVDARTKTYCAMLTTGVCDLPARLSALEAQLAERVKVSNGESLADEYRRLVSEYNEPDTDGTRDEAWNLIADFAIANYGTILSSLEATPAAPKVTEAMVEALKEARSVIYDTQQSCLYDDDDGQVGVTEDAVISPYHFQKICNSLKVIDDALTAAQEAGK